MKVVGVTEMPARSTVKARADAPAHTSDIYVGPGALAEHAPTTGAAVCAADRSTMSRTSSLARETAWVGTVETLRSTPKHTRID